jgi:hypothetical protein
MASRPAARIPAYPATTSPHYPGVGSPHYPAAGAIPPGAPVLWFDAQDINLLGNVGVADNDPIGTWKNKGSFGASGDVVQGTAANRPLFKLVAAAGKLNNLSALRGDGSNDNLVSGVTAVMTQPNLVCAVVRRSSTTDSVWIDGRVNTNRIEVIYLNSSADQVAVNAGSSQVSNKVVTQNTYHQVCATLNGASTALRVNKATATIGNAGTQTADGITLFSNADPSAYMSGDIAEVLVYSGSLPTVADVEAYFDAKYGSSWPQ